MDGIISQQMRVCLDRSKIVDGNDLDIASSLFDDGTKDVVSNSAKTVYRDPQHHHVLPLVRASPTTLSAASITASTVIPNSR